MVEIMEQLKAVAPELTQVYVDGIRVEGFVGMIWGCLMLCVAFSLAYISYRVFNTEDMKDEDQVPCVMLPGAAALVMFFITADYMLSCGMKIFAPEYMAIKSLLP